jgi:hypothetical protein
MGEAGAGHGLLQGMGYRTHGSGGAFVEAFVEAFLEAFEVLRVPALRNEPARSGD